MWGRGARKRESVSHLGAQLQAEGGMGPGTADFCLEALPAAFLRLSRKLFLLYMMCAMCVGWKALIGQNLLNNVKSCNEMKRFILH
jgi:hypothetical protein